MTGLDILEKAHAREVLENMGKNQKKIEITYRKIEDLRPYAKNPRRNDAAVPALAESIRRYGFKNPIIVDRDGVIISGHTRLKAAKRLGLHEVPVIVADDLTEKEAREFIRDLEEQKESGRVIYGSGYLVPRGPVRKAKEEAERNKAEQEKQARRWSLSLREQAIIERLEGE